MPAVCSRKSCILAVLSAALLVAPATHAQWYNPSTWFKKKSKRPELLIVTGNYVKSRILAELIQTREKQPVLLLPTGTEKNLYALGPKKEAMEVNAADFAEFVEFLKPKQIIFLGDKNYCPQSWIDKVKDDHACWVADSSDWEQVAISAERMLKIKNLAIDYLYLLHQLDDKGRPIQPTVVPDKPEFEKFLGDGDDDKKKKKKK